jgi:ATP-dependent Clp protease ATP-binding subunit ClpX
MNNNQALQTPAACSFCARPRHDVTTLISGQSGYICDSCVMQCGDMIHGREDAQEAAADSPRALFDYLSSRVIGQDAAKKQLSASVYHHQFGKRGAGSSPLLKKQNLLFLGPTGSGKTYLVRSLARSLGIPIATVSATAFTKNGYVGDEADSMLRYLLDSCDNDVQKAENGIVFIDEVDKIARSAGGGSLGPDVSGAGVQQDLLTMMEGCTVRLPAKGGPKHLAQEFITLNTENIMFVAAGAFVGLEDIVARRLQSDDETAREPHPKKRENQLRRQVLVDDLIDFGLLPEFAGRFTACVPFDHLLTEDLITILNNPNGSPIEEYKRYFDAYGVELVVEDDGISAIAERAEELATGARGLRSIVDRCFQDALFELPEWQDVARVVFTRDAVLSEHKPLLLASDGTALDRRPA